MMYKIIQHQTSRDSHTSELLAFSEGHGYVISSLMSLTCAVCNHEMFPQILSNAEESTMAMSFIDKQHHQ